MAKERLESVENVDVQEDPISKAQRVIREERQGRARRCAAEIDALLERHNCVVVTGIEPVEIGPGVFGSAVRWAVQAKDPR